jgi:hypothetical protein
VTQCSYDIECFASKNRLNNKDPGRPCGRWNSEKSEQAIGLILELEKEKKKKK